MGNPTAFNFITPEKAAELDKGAHGRSAKQFRAELARKSGCDVCSQPVWIFGGMGMCFPCTTGETDASNDYEVRE